MFKGWDCRHNPPQQASFDFKKSCVCFHMCVWRSVGSLGRLVLQSTLFEAGSLFVAAHTRLAHKCLGIVLPSSRSVYLEVGLLGLLPKSPCLCGKCTIPIPAISAPPQTPHPSLSPIPVPHPSHFLTQPAPSNSCWVCLPQTGSTISVTTLSFEIFSHPMFNPEDLEDLGLRK